MLGKWFQKQKRNRWAVDKLHNSIQAQALRPDFYYEGGVRDNFSGRFEMTSLLATLVFRRLRTAGVAGKDLAQDCFGALFDGFDEALRDIGTGDLSVGKKIRKMERRSTAAPGPMTKRWRPTRRQMPLERRWCATWGSTKVRQIAFAGMSGWSRTRWNAMKIPSCWPVRSTGPR